LDEAEQNGFGPAFLLEILLLISEIVLIGPGGLLLVVSHICAVPVLVLLVGFEKINN
jgi:hypothetical protein